MRIPMRYGDFSHQNVRTWCDAEPRILHGKDADTDVDALANVSFTFWRDCNPFNSFPKYVIIDVVERYVWYSFQELSKRSQRRSCVQSESESSLSSPLIAPANCLRWYAIQQIKHAWPVLQCAVFREMRASKANWQTDNTTSCKKLIQHFLIISSTTSYYTQLHNF